MTVSIAVLIPCLNEEISVAKVVEDFRSVLPDAEIYVYDNNSDDNTIEVARLAGATVRIEGQRGKGNVIRRMFADVEADVYVLVDGDDTYGASAAPEMVKKLLSENLDMVNGRRVATTQESYRFGHLFGNRVLNKVVAATFGPLFSDMLSGFKVFSRRFAKSFPVLSEGFEIETELTIFALGLRMPVAEMPVPYQDRAKGSESKLSMIRDGYRIAKLISSMVKNERPLAFFFLFSFLFMSASLGLGVPVVFEFLETGLVDRLPTALLATGLALISGFFFTTGLVLDTVTRGRKEMKRIAYLSIPGSHHRAED